MSIIWFILVFASLTVLVFTNPSIALNAMMQGANEAVTLSIKLVATYSLWLGFFNLMEKVGISKFIAKILKPIVDFLFPNSSDEAKKYACMNMSANLLGLANAATPMGIGTIEQMDKNNESAGDMKTFLVISATSLQLLPTTVLAMRVNANSVNPTAILIPCIIATVSSTVLGVIICKIIEKIKDSERKKLNIASKNYPNNLIKIKVEKEVE